METDSRSEKELLTYALADLSLDDGKPSAFLPVVSHTDTFAKLAPGCYRATHVPCPAAR